MPSAIGECKFLKRGLIALAWNRKTADQNEQEDQAKKIF